MPQMLLPIFPPGLNHISEHVGFKEEDGRIYYFHGMLPVFSHAKEDLASFKFITSQLVVGGNAKLIDISKAFGIPYINVKRNISLLKKEGSGAFFKPRKGRTAHVLTRELVEKAQQLLYKGHSVPEVARRLDIKAPTIRKAIQQGKLRKKN
jgi:transposase